MDIQFQFGADSVQEVVENQRKQCAGYHRRSQRCQHFRLVAGHDIDDVLAYHARDQRQRCAEDTQQRIENNSSLVSSGIGKDPLPVIDDLTESAFLITSVQGT